MFNYYSLIPITAPLSSDQQQQVNNSAITWLIIFLVVVLIVWWLISLATRHSPANTEAHSDGHDDHDEAAIHEKDALAASKAGKPIAEFKPAKPDNLAELEGIGAKVNTLLQQAGITTFSQLAQTDVQKLTEILGANGLQFMDPSSWPQQAKLASENKSDELRTLQERLKGGRNN
jgi:predicted flap endonuclease-1-like 5' DNA nuclease